MTARWRERESDPSKVAELEDAGLPRLLARLLAAREVSAQQADAFMNPALGNLSAPSELPGIVDAAQTILDAVGAGREIAVFGDYDCDGICATAILVHALTAIGAKKVFPFLPERLSEGYGMTDKSVARMITLHPNTSLVITVDNGITSIDQVAWLKSRGVDVIVTDHHIPGDVLPDCPIVNPKLAAPKKLEGICGAGVAFFLANAIVNLAKERGMFSGGNIAGPLLVLAGLATVTDIMPLRDENRIFVTAALKLFPKWAPLGLKELHERALRRTAVSLNEKDFGFLIGPRINATGRIGSGIDALDLVLTSDRERARELARKVDLRNTERKTIELSMTETAAGLLIPGASAQILDIPDGHPGVAGIVAARILDRISTSADFSPVPVCVIVNRRGSARAPAGFNLHAALTECSECLANFGGHSAAGGFTVKEGMMDAFREAFSKSCAKQVNSSDSIVGVTYFDSWVEKKELTTKFVETLEKLAPYGEGNPEPVFGLENVYLSDVQLLGQEGSHLQISIKGGYPRGVWWGHGQDIESLRKFAGETRDIFFVPEISTYLEPHVELRILDIRMHEE